ncbi:sulfotransferase [uncultured Demequina sp.]|uniref:sulfotransferase family protein n=1 Tax=uncultured Demequina sp. TaxID=693499 RepID=UPI0025F32B0F|nr:sulfotransferase [uncultured Demequina sp.]
MNQTDYRMVFIGGMHRSGTTLLADLIASSPRASGFSHELSPMGEGQHLQDVFPTGRDYGGPVIWGLDPRAHLTENHLGEDHPARLWDAWKPHWDMSCELLVEKSPINLTKFRYLQAAFPGARMVAITRHPISQAIAVKKWSDRASERSGWDLDRPVRSWLSAHGMFAADQRSIDHLLVLRYEDLILDPGPAVAQLERFLEIEVDPRAVAGIDPSALSKYEEIWSGATTMPVASRDQGSPDLPSTGRAARSKAKRRATLRWSRSFRRFGYRATDLRHARPWKQTA